MTTPNQSAGFEGAVAAVGGRRQNLPIITVVLVLCSVAILHLTLWRLAEPRIVAAPVEAGLASVSYNRFAKPSELDSGIAEERIRADLTAIAKQADAVRTYASTQGLERVPEIAASLGLNVTLGIWIDKDDARNQREIETALDLARHYHNVTRLVVGNESIFRHEHTAAEMAEMVRRVKRDSPVPVAAADNWKTFADHPELVAAVDQVFAHIIPYWEGFRRKTAVKQSLALYDELRAAYPGKKIVIGEFGWPSAGHNFEHAVPGPLAQAGVLRDFVAEANSRGIDYNIVEAIDQPEKIFEGNVGPYWGILDASLRPKFPWTGPLVDADYWKAAWLAILVGSLFSLSILALPGATVSQAAVLAGADHLIGDWCAGVQVYWHDHYLLHGEVITFAIALPLLGLLAPIVLFRVHEMTTVALGGKPWRLLNLLSPVLDRRPPKVSVHIPAYHEPPDMLLRTIDSVAQLDYPNFECVVIINNTPDPAFWKPIEQRCRELGERFKFICVQNLQGFKAGALRLAMTETADDAEIIGVIDADYVIDPRWLRDLVPGFVDPKVGLIQAPQDHRDGCRSSIHAAMNAEYAGFFDIGMVERNEVNAIIVHGTMCLIRRTALEAAGGWSSDTICEDSDLGLTILELGWRADYTNHRYGWGLLPRDYLAFKTQRARWASGAVQIVKKHWRRFLPGGSLLDHDQKREFAFGWLSWFGAEIVAVAAALLNLIWTPFVVFQVVAIPDPLLLLPSIATFVVSLLHFVSAYRTRIAISYSQMLGAMVVFMSVQWTVASAAFAAAFPAQKTYFHVTRKGAGGSIQPRFPAIAEAVLGSLLVASGMTVFVTNTYRLLETDLFGAILIIQSLPFLSAVALAGLERLGDARNTVKKETLP
jgi:cellulose synthase/poly-beta-1,6-N-acetylglucosamine synthase-like glycosyltransferase/exo-beta-1,3-glucanase (GH17 family)